jgi:hypothetical protein
MMGKTHGLRRRLFVLSILAIGIVVLSPVANTTILTLGACPAANPGDTVTPCLANGQGPGTLLASLSAPFTTPNGTTSGTLVSAVFRETGGTLDFYYQVFVNTTSTNCGTAGKPACDPLSRETDTDFSTWLTQLAFRTDGSTLPGGLFVNGDTTPQTADRNVSPGDVIGFTFNGAPTPSSIQPGHSSNVIIISTNAVNFKAGNATVLDGSGVTVASFAPAPAPPTIAKAFGAASIPQNNTTSLTLTITNPNTAITLSGIAFTDALPAGLVVATPGNLTNSCGGTATAVNGSSSVSLSGGALAPSATCTISVTVQGTTSGVKNNSVQVSSTNGGTGNTASASITVN